MIADLKPYAEYKESCLPWIGNVPAHWELLPNRGLVRKRKVLVGKHHKDFRLLSLTKQGVIVRDISTGKGKFSSDMGTSQVIREGDLVFCLFDVPETPRTVGLSRHDGMITGAYTVFESVGRGSREYFELFYRAMDDRKLLSPLYSGLRHTIPPERFLGTKTPQPSLDEQEAIVRFLSWTNGRLERAIRAKRKVIALLNEQKQAIIHRAVTRGLDPSVPLKPSGIPWLGDIPNNWKVRRLKFVASQIVDCLHATPRYSQSGLYPAIRTADIEAGALRLQNARKISPMDYARWTERLEPREDDILYSREGERFGIAACVPEGVRLCISQRMMVFRIAKTDYPRFVMWLLNSKPTYAQALQDVMGATAPHVNISTIRNYSLAMPAFDEQKAIVNYIETETHPIGHAVIRLEREIDLLREYRTRLVADVVTGKLDVREAAAKLPVEEQTIEPEELVEDDSEMIEDEITEAVG